MTQAKSKTATKATATEAPAVVEDNKAEASAAGETETSAVVEDNTTEATASGETEAPAVVEGENQGLITADQARALSEKALAMIAINTVGNHKPGTSFTAKDKAAFDRFISLGAAKKA